MVQPATGFVSFVAPAPLPLTVDFLGGRLTSDGGWTWVAEADAAVGLIGALAGGLPDPRRRRGRHTVQGLLRQRLYQNAAGYADQNDTDALRGDPLLKMACGRRRESAAALASEITFSRFENAFSARDCYRLAEALGEVHLRERARLGRPIHIVLDFDGTDDPTHGTQEGSACHGYFRQHMCCPLLVFDEETGHLITAILRRVVERRRERWAWVTSEIRADAGLAKPEIYAWCEEHGSSTPSGWSPIPA